MPRGKHREDYQRKRTGEKRAVRQPTAIEKLPGELRDKLRAFVDAARDGRCKCRPKEVMHRHSWDGVAEAANRTFALRLSASQYHRDYDLYVEQQRAEDKRRHEGVRELAEFFAAHGIQNLPESVLNALAGEFFAAAEAPTAEERKAARLNFGMVLAKLLTARASTERVELEKQKLEARRDALRAVEPREIYLAAAEELLKRLRTRKALREALDPIQKDLIEELSKSAESFAKRIEAQSAG